MNKSNQLHRILCIFFAYFLMALSNDKSKSQLFLSIPITKEFLSIPTNQELKYFPSLSTSPNSQSSISELIYQSNLLSSSNTSIAKNLIPSKINTTDQVNDMTRTYRDTFYYNIKEYKNMLNKKNIEIWVDKERFTLSLEEVSIVLDGDDILLFRNQEVLKKVLRYHANQPNIPYNQPASILGYISELYHMNIRQEVMKARHIGIKHGLNKEYVISHVKEKMSSYNISPVSAKIQVTDDEIRIIDEIVGEGISIDALMSDVENQFISWDGSRICIEGKKYRYKTAITKHRIIDCSTILGTYTTKLTGSAARNTNISNAVSKLQGIILMPNQTFSSNSILSPYTVGNGYTSSRVFTEKDIVDGVGGGVCQVTSTLYNTVLLSELDVIERHPHAFMVDYVNPTLDATVTSGEKDFVFQNSTSDIIYIVATITEEEVTITIYGKDTRISNRRIKFQVDIERYYMPSDIQDGRYGCKAYLYKIIEEDSKKIAEILLYYDIYDELNNIN